MKIRRRLCAPDSTLYRAAKSWNVRERRKYSWREKERGESEGDEGARTEDRGEKEANGGGYRGEREVRGNAAHRRERAREKEREENRVRVNKTRERQRQSGRTFPGPAYPTGTKRTKRTDHKFGKTKFPRNRPEN